jgi:hypothetical protein
VADPREALADALAGFLTPEQTRTLVDEVLAVTKKGRADFSCKSCGQRQIQFALIPDARAVASALTDLANQAYGRPVEAAAAQVEPIKFVRLTNLSELEEHASSKPPRGPRRNKTGEISKQRGAAARKRGSYQGKKQLDKES